MVGGKASVPMRILDASGFIPLVLCVTAYVYSWWRGQFSIGLWNKTFIVASCMAVLKGVFDVVTILPDSSGWNTCQQRLGHKTIEQFKQARFAEDLDGAFWRLLSLELFGDHGKRVRYCADMMVSGHTYFAALFSVSAVKQTYYSGVGKGYARVVGIICGCCMVTEFVLVAAARFHYTVDMLIAIALVGLLFDSNYVEQLAADWSEGFRWREPFGFEPHCSPCFNLLRGRSKPPMVSPNEPGEEQQALMIEEQSQDETPRIIASRAVGLVNPRVTNGHPPWTWQTFADLEDKARLADEEEIKWYRSQRGEAGPDATRACGPGSMHSVLGPSNRP